MSSNRRYGREGYGGDRGGRDDHRDYGRMYDDRPAEDHDYRPRTSPHAYDRSRTPPRSYKDSQHSTHRDNERYDRRGSPPHRGQRGPYRDRDREGYRSPGRSQSRSRSRSRRRSRSPRFGGPANKEVMLDGLPLDMSEEDVGHHLSLFEYPEYHLDSLCLFIFRELKRFYDVVDLDDVRVIRDKQTKQPRGFAFIRFRSLDTSKDFVESNYPSISLYGGAGEDEDRQPTKVRIVYGREREERRPEKQEADWTCRVCSFANFAGRRMCFKCRSPLELAGGGDVPQKPEYVNTGDSDASPDGTPSQFLLIRGLEPGVTEELLAKGVAKMYKPSGQLGDSGAKPAKKSAKVASTTGDANLGAKDGTVKRVMLVRDRATDESWRYGFAEFLSVDDAQAALTRYHSFERFTIASKPVEVSYIHAGVFVPVFDLASIPEGVTFTASTNSAISLQYWDESAYVSELVVYEPEEAAGRAGLAARTAADAAVEAAQKEGLVDGDVDSKNKKRKGETKDANKTKKVAPAHLQFWSNRHAELHGLPAKQPEGVEGEDDAPQSEADPAEEPSRPTQQSYADRQRKCCLLCLRQFKTDTELNKHERLSKLHADNLQDPGLLAKAAAKLAKAGITPVTVAPGPSSPSTGPEYRDRAKERRRAFGSAKPSLPMKQQSGSPAKDDAEQEAPAAQSKGAALMGKMGWAAGQGLGAGGAGVTELIPLDKYAAGVGLGAEGGKLGDAATEAARNTRGDYAGFVERAREKAKERFDKMA